MNWARAEAELRAALGELRSVIDTASVPWVDEFLDHNELGVAMDALVDAALASPTRAIPEAAIHHIRLASAQMDGYVPNNWDEFISRFG